MDPCDHNSDGCIADKPPATDGFHRLTKRVRRHMIYTQKDTKFLKKMNASFPGVMCTIDSFVDISGHSLVTQADVQGADMEADECPDIRDGPMNYLSKE